MNVPFRRICVYYKKYKNICLLIHTAPYTIKCKILVKPHHHTMRHKGISINIYNLLWKCYKVQYQLNRPRFFCFWILKHLPFCTSVQPIVTMKAIYGWDVRYDRLCKSKLRCFESQTGPGMATKPRVSSTTVFRMAMPAWHQKQFICLGRCN